MDATWLLVFKKQASNESRDEKKFLQIQLKTLVPKASKKNLVIPHDYYAARIQSIASGVEPGR